MHLDGIAYNWYMWWKAEKVSYTWHTFKNDFFKRFQGITEDEFFKKLTHLQQKGSVEEFTSQWEALTTSVFGLSQQQLLETYVGGLKPHLQNELKMHDIPSVEVARCKAKEVEEKIESFQARNGNTYSRRSILHTTERDKDKYTPPHMRYEKRTLEAQ